MIIFNIFFYIVAFFILFSAVMAMVLKNPMANILFLVFCFLNTGILFVLLKAEFIAAILLIVYVGAISILYLFVIMFLDYKLSISRQIKSKSFLLGASLSFIILIEFVAIIKSNLLKLPISSSLDNVNSVSNFYELSYLLFNNYSYSIVVLGILLTIVSIGIIYILHEPKENVKKQNMKDQRNTDTSSVSLKKVDIEKGTN